ncbi:MAG: dipeptide ABC transporter ATP-binding protein [Caldisericota bacterium]|jgi:oligopeptide transport system ATP-binding protein|nr:dipeptide ABC transporter ATP-binding protein [Caldisericota bacterium]
MATKLVEVQKLKKWFPIKGGVLSSTVAHVKAVDEVDFFINEGETLGLVGESGSGKTTAGRTMLKLLEPTSGRILYKGQDVSAYTPNQMRPLRRNVQIMFQDPYGSLNPRMPVGDIIQEPLDVHVIGTRSERRAAVAAIMETVGLRSEYQRRYPHEFSGGQRQRIGVARALILNPELLVLDEPISALDVSIQSQIINLLQELQQKRNLTYLFIAHDLAVVRHMSDRVAVMYLGKIVETAENDELFDHPMHPYTQALLSAVPVPDPDVKRERIILQGDIPSPVNPPSGCHFRTRCPYAMPVCREQEPIAIETAPEHTVACHLLTKK